VEYLVLQPCSFSEFLGAIGEEQIKDKLLPVEQLGAIRKQAEASSPLTAFLN